MAASSGIPRSRGTPTKIQLVEGDSPASVRRNLENLASAFTAIQAWLNLVDDRLSKRINEMLLSGTLAERPDPGVQDRVFFAQDTGAAYYDDGTDWRAL